jgi:hypothetical protein
MEYAINKKHIAATLCVNQDKPELKCNGQCYLMLQLKAMAPEQGPDSSTQVPPVVSVEEVLSAHIVNSFTCCKISPEQQVIYRSDVSPHLTEVHLATPKPPPRFS